MADSRFENWFVFHSQKRPETKCLPRVFRASLRPASEDDCQWVRMDTENPLVDHQSPFAIIDDLTECFGICKNRIDYFDMVALPWLQTLRDSRESCARILSTFGSIDDLVLFHRTETCPDTCAGKQAIQSSSPPDAMENAWIFVCYIDNLQLVLLGGSNWNRC